jgi:CheY-like chemotaxis protein
MKKYKIIIVENDEDEQLFMREGFDEVGSFDIMAQVKNGEMLMEWLYAHTGDLPDIILSDLNMPGKNGYEILDEVNANPMLSHIPVVITSTSSTPSIIQKCLSKGAADYMVKPDTFVQYVPFVQDLYKRVERLATANDL